MYSDERWAEVQKRLHFALFYFPNFLSSLTACPCSGLAVFYCPQKILSGKRDHCMGIVQWAYKKRRWFLSKIKTGVARTAATSTNGIGRANKTTATANSGTKLKVTVHIPDTVQRRQEKINKIYDILKPKPTPSASATHAVSREAV